LYCTLINSRTLLSLPFAAADVVTTTPLARSFTVTGVDCRCTFRPPSCLRFSPPTAGTRCATLLTAATCYRGSRARHTLTPYTPACRLLPTACLPCRLPPACRLLPSCSRHCCYHLGRLVFATCLPFHTAYLPSCLRLPACSSAACILFCLPNLLLPYQFWDVSMYQYSCDVCAAFCIQYVFFILFFHVFRIAFLYTFVYTV